MKMNEVNVCHKERNIGLDLLKAWMAFEVVLCHFGHGSDEFVFRYFFTYFRSMAVPVFMIISFYLSARFVISKELQIDKLRKRLQRIYVPLITWAIIYWVAYNILGYCCGIYDFHLSFNDLVWQILTGHSYNTAMWFNVVLAFLTIIFWCICKLSTKYSTTIIILVSLSAIFTQFSGLNNIFMALRNELNFPLGRIAEMVPFAGFGVLLYKCINNKKPLIMLLFILSIVIVKLISQGLFCSDIFHYHYSGMRLLLCSTTLVAVFLFLPLQCLPKPVKKVIAFLSRYSMGVYCTHMLVGTVLAFFRVTFSPFLLTIVIYLVSLLLCYAISKIPYQLSKDIVM